MPTQANSCGYSAWQALYGIFMLMFVFFSPTELLQQALSQVSGVNLAEISFCNDRQYI